MRSQLIQSAFPQQYQNQISRFASPTTHSASSACTQSHTRHRHSAQYVALEACDPSLVPPVCARIRRAACECMCMLWRSCIHLVAEGRAPKPKALSSYGLDLPSSYWW